MQIKGQLFEVTNLESFAVSYLQNSAKPAAGTFKTAAGIRIELGSLIPGFPIGFFPSLSLHTNTASDGSFSFNITDAQLKQLVINRFAHIVAFRQTGSVSILGLTVPIFEPVYRSAPFDITIFKPKATEKIYFAPFNVPNSVGISQATVDSQIAAAKKKFSGIQKLSATILNGKISVSGSGHGADIKFNINPGVATSSDLDSFITGKVEDLDIDLPGPDFITGICVSKDDIAKEVDNGIDGIMKDANASIETTIINQVAEQTGQSKALVAALFKTTASITFRSLHFPVVEHRKIKLPKGLPDITIDIRAIVPQLAVGFPRTIK